MSQIISQSQPPEPFSDSSNRSDDIVKSIDLQIVQELGITFITSIRKYNMNYYLLSILFFTGCLIQHISTENPGLIIGGSKYLGRYSAYQSGQTFDYLESREGNIRVIFYSGSAGDRVDSLDLYLFDPRYADRRVVLIQIKELIYIENGIWTNQGHKMTYTTLWKGAIDEDYDVENVQTQISFKGYQQGNYQDVNIIISMRGDKFDFTSQLTFEPETLASLSASLFITLVVAIQGYSTWKILNLAGIPNVAYCNKLSLLTLSLCTAQDLTQVVNNIPYVVGSFALEVNQGFRLSYLFFLVPTLGYFFLFGIFELKIMLFVWRCHNLDIVGDPRMFKKRLTIAYIFFLCQYFAIFILGLFFINQEWFIIISVIMLLMPQIIRNFRMGHFPNFDYSYIYGFVGVRLLIPIYERLCPQNKFSLAPNIPVVITIVSIYGLQVALLYLQFRLGSRFFVPQRFRPNFYDYKCKLRLTENNKDLECTVCLQNLFELAPDASQSSMENDNEVNRQPLLQEKVRVMKTPCNHHFHEECLTQWMDVKMQCPTCRRELPPV